MYEQDPRDVDKQTQAAAIIGGLVEAERFALSAQCLSEFYNASRRLPEPLSDADALREVSRLARMGTVVDVTAAVVIEACRGCAEHQLSIWDALIWAAAKMNGIPYVLTEDAEHGRTIEQVTYLNPFAESFDLDDAIGLG